MFTDDEPSDPVTVIVSQRVKPGREADYEHWIAGIYADARKFQGHLGINVIRPTAATSGEYVMIFRFDSYANLKTWMESEVRQWWLDCVQPLIQGDAQVKTLSGLEAWFSPKGKAIVPPRRYKMFLVTWIAVYVLLNLFRKFLLPLIGQFPFELGSLILTALVVGSMTYFVMPRLTKWLYKWLYAETRRRTA